MANREQQIESTQRQKQALDLRIAGLPYQDIAERIVYASRDGQELVLHLFRPAGAAEGERRPALIWIHGGAWIGGTPDGFLPLARYFASRGLIGVAITYRLARPDGPTVADCIADCRSALRFVRAHSAALGVDTERIAVAGDSAGGHLAAALGTKIGPDHPADDLAVSPHPNALLLFNPVVDLTADEWIRFAVGGRALADRKSTRPSDESAMQLARALSPMHHVKAGQPPALLMHARGDRIVPVAQAKAFASDTTAAGNRCDLVLLGEEIGHAFVIAGYKWPEEVVVQALRTADEFLVSLGWLQGAPTLTTSQPPAWTPLPR